MADEWPGTFITDGNYSFTEKKVSPEPMNFKKKIKAGGNVVKAYVYATAKGIYEMYFDGKKVGDRYFAPGFTSYKKRLQYQTYDVTEFFKGKRETDVQFTVSGGWAVGSFIYSRNNRFAADRQALSAVFYFVYENGTADMFGTDSTWYVTRQGKVKMADLYDGETFDSTVNLDEACWSNAQEEKLKYNPVISADCGAFVKEHEVFTPVSEKINDKDNEIIYDFGQNFAGIVRFTVKNAKKGQVIEIRHAEILNPDGTLNRAAMLAIMNPDDKGGLELALQMKDKYGANVTVITMGPPQADLILREAFAMGVDRAILLSDRKFAGADTLATSYALAGAIKTMDYDLIIAGRQAIDGDTAQVGPEMAEHLGLPQVSYVIDAEREKNGNFIVKKENEDSVQTLEVEGKCVLTVLASAFEARYMTVAGIVDAYNKEVEVWGADKLDVDENKLGLKGSPTKVWQSFPKQLKAPGEVFEVSEEEAVEIIVNKLKEKHLI